MQVCINAKRGWMMNLQQTARQKPYRMMFRYWLDATKDEELALADFCEELKESRSFVSTIRQALTLIRDLRAGRLDSLFALFPWILGWLEERAEAIAEAKIRAEGGGYPEQIEGYLERIERLLEGQDRRPAARIEEHESPRLLASGDDDGGLITVNRAEMNPKVPSWNYAFAQAGLYGSGFDHLESDCLNYLLDNGKLKRSQLKVGTLEKLDFEAQNTVAMQPVSIKKMEINVDLSVPDYADDDDDLIGIRASNG